MLRLLLNMENYSDETFLLDRLRAGDEAALDRLFEAYYGYLFKIAYALVRDGDVAKDCVQNVFARLWQKRDTIKIKSTLKGYLQRTIVNECLGWQRQQKHTLSPDTQVHLPDPAHSPEETLQSEHLKTLIQAAIARLPEQCRLVFQLSRVEELSHREIAEQLDISPKTVENQIGKALKQLRETLGPWLRLLLPLLYASI